MATCYFCQTHKERGLAIEAGWIPSFWDVSEDKEINRPVCVDCKNESLTFNAERDDYETKGCSGGQHKFGPVELSRLAGNPHRKCRHCGEVSLDLDDSEDVPDGPDFGYEG